MKENEKRKENEKEYNDDRIFSFKFLLVSLHSSSTHRRQQKRATARATFLPLLFYQFFLIHSRLLPCHRSRMFDRQSMCHRCHELDRHDLTFWIEQQREREREIKK